MERVVEITRVFDAPRERVFEAWTRAEHLARWFCPDGFTVATCETEARPGGVLRLCMRSPDGKDHWMRANFRELVAPERLVIAGVADDYNGVQRIETLITVTLAEQGGKTRLTLHAVASGEGPEAEAMLGGMDQGWNQTIGKLAVHFAN